LKKKAKSSVRKDLLVCHWTGRLLGQISQRLDCAGGDLNDRNFSGAEHNIYQAKIELKDGAWAIGKSVANRLGKLLDDPLQAVKDAQKTARDGKEGPVGRGRLRPAEQALMKVMKRASNKCH
jgi:hypothetical protein